MLRVLLATRKPVLQQFRLLQVVKICCRKKERVVLLFAAKSVHVAHFPFELRDSRVILSIRSHYSRN